MVFRSSVYALAILTLAGCDTLSSSTTGGSSGSGWANESIFLAYDDISNPNVGTVTYGTALDQSGGTGFSGINPGATVGADIVGGSATYTANYEISEIYQITDSSGTLVGATREESGQIGLTADFDARTLQGSDGNFEVAGQINGGDFDGNVEYRGTEGSLDGEIGTIGVIGAFHGSSDTRVYSGGFVGETDTP